MSQHRIDDTTLVRSALQDHRHAHRENERGTKRQSEEFESGEHEERRQHHELPLREVDRAAGLPEKREADRDQRVDRADRKAGQDELQEVGHPGTSPSVTNPGLLTGPKD